MNRIGFWGFLGALSVFAAALCALWIYARGVEFDLRLLVGAAIFGSFLLMGEILSTRVSERLTISASDVGLVAAVVALGPTWAVLAALPADLLVGRKNPSRTAYEVSHSIIIIYLSGIVFSFSSTGPLLTSDPAPSVDLFYGVLMAGTTLAAANGTLHSVLLWVRHGQTFQSSWRENVQPYLFSNAVDVLTAGLVVLALVAYGPVAALLTVLGSAVSQALAHRSRQQVERNRELQEKVVSLEQALTSSNATFGTMMVQEMGRKDGYSHRHATATSVYAADLAREMRLDEGRVGRLRLAGLLHNIGMFGLPEEVLLSAGKLNSVAQHQLVKHPVRGEAMLGSVPEYEELASWVRWHHERPDGRGYPDKLRGAWIPLEAKILAVAQAYAAMVLDGPRRPGMTPAESRREMGAGVDTQFDGLVVRAFLRILDTESEGYRMADDRRFSFPVPAGRAGPKPEGVRGLTAAP